MEELIDNGAFYFKVKSWGYLISLGIFVLCVLCCIVGFVITYIKARISKRNGKRKANDFIKKYYERD